MSAGAVIFISGATGLNSAAVNGPFDRTSETSGGYAVYSKRGDASVCIEHRGGLWQVKDVSHKDTTVVWAYVASDCALQDCASRVWKVLDGITWFDQMLQASVKLATDSEAERQVCDAPAPHPHSRISLLFWRHALRFCTGC
jgi:hypothetical protein